MENSKDLVQALRAIEIAEAEYLAECNRKCDWSDPNDIAEYRREERMKERNEVLDRIVKTRKCPVCQQLKLDPSSWVISANCRKAICRSCYFRKWPVRTVNSPERIFVEERRFAVDGKVIRRLREGIGCSNREFSRRAGWGRTYQTSIEKGEVRTVSNETAEVILKVFEELGITTRDCT